MKLFRSRRDPPTLQVKKSPGTVTRLQLSHARLTDAVLVRPSVIAEAIEFCAKHAKNEVAGLLIGRSRGRYVVVERLHTIRRVGTSIAVDFHPEDFAAALKKVQPPEMIVGWFHSHPRLGVFLSDTDILHQTQSQDQWPEYVALVMDPFSDEGIAFTFFRADGDRYERVPHHFYAEGRNEA